MAPHFHLCFLFFIYTAAYHHRNCVQATSSAIKEACKATRFPKTCHVSLTKSGIVPTDPKPYQILLSTLSLSSKNLATAESMVQRILKDKHNADNHNLTTTAELCVESLRHSVYRLTSSKKALQHSRMKDARAWTSAALSYQFDCLSGLKKVNDTQLVAKTVLFMNNTLMTSTSNALSMMMSYERFGNRTSWWGPPRTERNGVWESVGGGSSGHEPMVPAGLKQNVTVCKGAGVCSFEMVQMAVDAAPDNLGGERRFVIMIKEGVYEEVVRVGLAKRNVMLIGDGIGKTVISGSLNVGKLGMPTYNTATVGVVGDGFMARDLTIQNTAGPEGQQAVAFRSDSDLSMIENCEFIGNQDTLYAHTLRQYYKSCIIQGNVDFIFGNSAAIFHNCTILVRPRELVKAGNSVISAHGRFDPAQTTGFVFQDCVVSGTPEYMQLLPKNPSVFLGRPWKEYSRSVFLRCRLEGIVSPFGWMRWDGEFALKTLYFGEFGNVGLGSNLSARVWWSSRTPADHVSVYSVHNFIQGDHWMLT
ncbi:putative pectinesterase [Helianthus annuus]|nr:probable pectinesterase/pectinesterase inhibitor 51 [Helianthus annuus]KAJ0539107.1 putative pectinesterase [Helianthus annuus]KAJ0719412.1 putative pectinesterase [Helianthus annuus]KAJ0901872.1 putative pectinesterase [Helianthus annuus]